MQFIVCRSERGVAAADEAIDLWSERYRQTSCSARLVASARR